jgi:hypothetical protein
MVLLSWSKLCNLFIAVLGLTIQLLICECYDPTKQFNPDDPTKQFNPDDPTKQFIPAALLYLSHVKTHEPKNWLVRLPTTSEW